jgi:hypothetical protein
LFDILSYLMIRMWKQKTKEKKMTQVIKYNDKEYKLPFAVGLSDDPTTLETIANRFSGEEVQLPQFAAAVYDTIIGAEYLEDYDTVRRGLTWFRQYFAKEYMTILD